MNLIDALRAVVDKISPPQVSNYVTPGQENSLIPKHIAYQQVDPTRVPGMAQYAPSPTPQPTGVPSGGGDMLKRGFSHWNSPPAATLSGTMAAESQKYPILQKHPELLAVLTLLESGGMKNMPGDHNSEFSGDVTNENRQFNGYGWGLNPDYSFNPHSPEEVIAKVAKGIATKPQYEAFRKSGNIADLAQVYSPYNAVTNPHGGDRYVNNYNSIADWFK